jgi:hypothetical protein
MDKFAKGAAWLMMGALAAAGLPSPSGAQTPSYARPGYASDEETIHGRIVSFAGAYTMEVRDDRGFIDHVSLRQGTIINPVGLRLVQGMSVTVLGYNRGGAFQANEIDTPYTAEYPGPAYGYGYGPYYPYGPYYSPGILIAPSFGFGWGYRHGWR